ncbi:hypothetical protein BY996DRAFT_8402868 [Phakopsora pachyrhizi]|nr:hypothetical protein BY996DRAFT_8402868 [Phakopsora pachyrhizi]
MNNKLPDEGREFSSEPVVDEMMRGCLVEIGKGDEKNEESDDGGRIIDGGNNTGKVCSADDEHTEKPNR